MALSELNVTTGKRRSSDSGLVVFECFWVIGGLTALNVMATNNGQLSRGFITDASQKRKTIDDERLDATVPIEDITAKDGTETLKKKNKKHKKHKSKKKRKKRKDEKESSSESGVESDADTQKTKELKKVDLSKLDGDDHLNALNCAGDMDADSKVKKQKHHVGKKKKKRRKEEEKQEKKSSSPSGSGSSSASGSESEPDSKQSQKLQMVLSSLDQKSPITTTDVSIDRCKVSSPKQEDLKSDITSDHNDEKGNKEGVEERLYQVPEFTEKDIKIEAVHEEEHFVKSQELPDIIPKQINVHKEQFGQKDSSKEANGNLKDKRKQSLSRSRSRSLSDTKGKKAQHSRSKTPKQSSGLYQIQVERKEKTVEAQDPQNQQRNLDVGQGHFLVKVIALIRGLVKGPRNPEAEPQDAIVQDLNHLQGQDVHCQGQNSLFLEGRINVQDPDPYGEEGHHGPGPEKEHLFLEQGGLEETEDLDQDQLVEDKVQEVQGVERSRRSKSRSPAVPKRSKRGSPHSPSVSPQRHKRSKSRSSSHNSRSETPISRKTKKEKGKGSRSVSRSVSRDQRSSDRSISPTKKGHSQSPCHEEKSENKSLIETPVSVVDATEETLNVEETAELIRWKPIEEQPVQIPVTEEATSSECNQHEETVNEEPADPKEFEGRPTTSRSCSREPAAVQGSLGSDEDDQSGSSRPPSPHTKKDSKSKSNSSKRRSKSPARKRKSRSPSHSRKRRTKSRSPVRKRRSRSSNRRGKSRSKSRTRTKRSKSHSRSPARKKRSRSRSPARKKRSRSRSRARRSRSKRSRSVSRRRRPAFRGRSFDRRDRWKREPSHSPVLILRKRRSTSRSRHSSSKTPPRITDFDKEQLLEIAKANAAAMCVKAGMPVPESLRPKTFLQLPLPTPTPTPLSLPLPLPVPNLSMNLQMGIPGIPTMPNMTMNAAVASMTAATMTAALSNMGALAAMSPIAPLPTITNKPPPAPAPNLANIEEVKRKVNQQANSISIKEFTEKCKQIASSKEEMIYAMPHFSDEEDDARYTVLG
ncbi:hypothetical protein DNTS_002287 [Danionella cerebrum]|uniref:Protein SON n=1 Tax=Danionella cerebrum TaxID=2873325 RepID=A0A553Q4J4_9TELE|nr:hypothetical protein DNTS_002287 [Danionella translucida]